MNLLYFKKGGLTSFQIIILGFLAVILLGTLLLMMPFSSRGGIATPFMDALFTSVSAVCVTGLVVYDTASYWSGLGQFIIMLLIQIGGMGIITVVASFSMISGRRISLMQRSTIQEAVAAPKVGGIVRLTGFIVKITLIIELLGAAIMAPVFCRDFGSIGLWMALFHSVSAFCNAGFDIMGKAGPFSSLTGYASDPLINLTVIFLIIIGGIGFLTWDDIRENGIHLRRYRMQSKVILCTTLILLLIPSVYFFFFEFTDFDLAKRVLSSVFQSATTRTAGFNTVDFTAISEPGQYIIIFLMLIGGSPGSTAGGMKTTTAAVLFGTAVSTFLRREHICFFGRRIGDNVVKNAATILIMYLVMFFSAGLVISTVEGLPMLVCLFETASAMGTAGLSLGITVGLKTVSKIILIILMFTGRVGGLTVIFATLIETRKNISKFPQERITVG